MLEILSPTLKKEKSSGKPRFLSDEAFEVYEATKKLAARFQQIFVGQIQQSP